MTAPRSSAGAPPAAESAHTPYLGFARRSYQARILGLALGLPMVLSVLYERPGMPWYAWLGPLLHPIAIGFVTNQALRKLQRQREELEKLSRLDGLSGLANRSHWESLVRKEFARCRRTGHRASLVLADLDHFKQINDLYGHAVGDETLRRFAALLGRELRLADTAGRYGGEEFGILLPHTTAERARDLLTRLRQSLHERPLLEARAVTASFGVAELTPELDSHEAWMRVADQMLYRAKHLGRDRIVLPGDPGEAPAPHVGQAAIRAAAAATRPDVLAHLLTGIDLGENAFALFDPSDRLALANPAFLGLYQVPPGAIGFAELMRHCHAHKVGPRIDTVDMEAWLKVADGQRRSHSHRAFDLRMADGRGFRAEETSFGEGWVLLALTPAAA